MAREPEGTPSREDVEQDFTMPEDADLRPVDADAEGDPVEPEGAVAAEGDA